MQKMNIQIPVHASLYLILNEHNGVLGYEIVPDDTRIHINSLLSSIFDDIPKSQRKPTKFFCTDNVLTDTDSLTGFFKKLNPKTDFFVLQDVFHAEQRVLRLLPKWHSDYFLASSALKKIFAILPQYDAYPTISTFTAALNRWSKTFQQSYGDMGPKAVFTKLGKLYLHIQ